MDWESKFPLVMVQALNRAGSDHTPLLLDTGDQAFVGNSSKFSFELSWFRQDGLYDMIARKWRSKREYSCGTMAKQDKKFV